MACEDSCLRPATGKAFLNSYTSLRLPCKSPTRPRAPYTSNAAMLTNAGFLARIRDRAQRVKDPSQCTPDRETAFNNADNIERQLQEDGHKIWGWVIYRCTYKSNEEWVLFMVRLRYYIDSTLRYDNALDDAYSSAVRQHFMQWAATAARARARARARRRQTSWALTTV
jgi:hypothetical protein